MSGAVSRCICFRREYITNTTEIREYGERRREWGGRKERGRTKERENRRDPGLPPDSDESEEGGVEWEMRSVGKFSSNLLC